MPAAAKPKTDLIERTKMEYQEIQKAAEELLFRIVREPDAVSVDDYSIFEWLSWDRQRLDRELGRVRNVVERQAQAGTDAEYASLVESLSELAQSVPAAIEKYQLQVDALQSKIADERAKLTPVQRRLEQIELARSALRGMVPSHVRKLYERNLSAQKGSEFAKRYRETESRISIIEKVLSEMATFGFDTDPRHFQIQKRSELFLNHARAACPEIVRHLQDPKTLKPNESDSQYILATDWAQYIDRLRSELASLRAAFPAIQADYQLLLADAESVLDYYLKEES